METTYNDRICGWASTFIRRLGYDVRFNWTDEANYSDVSLRDTHYHNFIGDFDTATAALRWAIDTKLADRPEEYEAMMSEIEATAPELYNALTR